MEQPFQCHRCNKKFSRHDNLNQHLRTHMRADAEGVTGTTAGYMATMGEDESAHADVEDGRAGGDCWVSALAKPRLRVTKRG